MGKTHHVMIGETKTVLELVKKCRECSSRFNIAVVPIHHILYDMRNKTPRGRRGAQPSASTGRVHVYIEYRYKNIKERWVLVMKKVTIFGTAVAYGQMHGSGAAACTGARKLPSNSTAMHTAASGWRVIERKGPTKVFLRGHMIPHLKQTSFLCFREQQLPANNRTTAARHACVSSSEPCLSFAAVSVKGRQKHQPSPLRYHTTHTRQNGNSWYTSWAAAAFWDPYATPSQ